MVRPPAKLVTAVTTLLALGALTGCGASASAEWAQPSGAPSATGSAPAAPSSGAASARPSASADPQQARFAAAAALLKTKQGTLGIIVRDRRTGAYWRARPTDPPTLTAAAPKVATVTRPPARARARGVTPGPAAA